MNRIIESHRHEDKVCYKLTTRGGPGKQLTQAGIFQTTGRQFVMAYLPYTGHWYAFNPKTGEEIASFSRRFYEEHIALFRIADIVPDPDCEPR